MTPLIVFDLDGTLVDSRADLAASADELLHTLGAAPLGVDAVSAMVGDGAKVLVERVLAAREVTVPVSDALGRFLEIYERRLVDQTRPYPGIIDMLEQLRPVAPLALLTNKPSRHTHLMLAALGLAHYFFVVVGGDDRFGRKPDPSGLQHIVRLVGAGCRETVMVGDSHVDAETAERAGTSFCFVHYGFGSIADARRMPRDRHFEAHDPRALGGVLLDALGRISKPT